MIPTFGLPQAVGRRTAFALHQAREAFGRVEIEMLLRDDPFQAEEILEMKRYFCRMDKDVRDFCKMYKM